MITKEQALEALDNLDDYTRMEVPVDAHGPVQVIGEFIEQNSLTHAEYDQVLAYRKKVQDAEERRKKQESCDHDWRYVCAMHNDSAYECIKCGATEYR